MTENNTFTGARLLLACFALIIGLGVTSRAQLRVAPIQPDQIGDEINCYVGGSRYQLNPDRELIHATSFALAFAPSNLETQKLFDAISRHTDLRINIYTVPVKNARVNVEICPSDGGRNYIAYSPAWLQRIYDETQNAWVLYAIVAHEVGHLVLSHDRTALGSNPKVELEADEYAGGILALMGAPLADAQAAFRSMPPSTTHPPAAERTAAVQRGWEKTQATNPKYSYALRGEIKYIPYGSDTVTTVPVDETTPKFALREFKQLYGQFVSVSIQATQLTNGRVCATGTMGNSPHQHMHVEGLPDDIALLSVGAQGKPGPYFKGGWQGKVVGNSGYMFMEIFFEPTTACDGR
jgi:hypothetical protein